jgi:hypothetical protein
MATITQVAPNNATFSQSDVQHCTSGRILSLALSAHPTRIYAGSFCGVWRSDDSGQTFYQLVGPLTETAGKGIFGGIYARHIFDLAASPADPNLVLAAARDGQFTTNRDGIYRSADGGHSWELVLPLVTAPPSLGVSQVLFSPDDPNLVYAALGFDGVAISTDAGENWNTQFLGANIWHLAVAPSESPGVRKVYACGDIPNSPNVNIFFSNDGGNSWSFDNGVSVINGSRANLAAFQVGCGSTSPVGSFANQTGTNNTSAPQIMAVEPGNAARVYLGAVGGAFGPTYYNDQNIPPDGTQANTECKRLADEGSLWIGDFSQFANTGTAVWTAVAGPNIYSGAGDTPSGNLYVIAKPTSSGYLLFFSDMNHVFVSQGFPSSFDSWHRLGGKDASVAHKDGTNFNFIFVHADPHGLITTPDFEITLKPATGVSDPYNLNAELDQFIGGTIWMACDGGIFWSDGGGVKWNRSNGLETLDPINIAGLAGIGDKPAIYFGCGDNDDFFTRDGGQNWFDPVTGCGDCDAWFADEAQADRVLQFEPRHLDSNLGKFTPGVNVIISGDPSRYPDAGDSGSFHFIHSPLRPNGRGYPISDLPLRGFRPIIRTLPTEAPLPDGDYVFIHSPDGMTRQVVRTTSIFSIGSSSDWGDSSKVQFIGVPLPGLPTDKEPVVQASGGHANPVFYVNDAKGVLRTWDPPSNSWKQIVPGGGSNGALMFFVDPFNPLVIYIVDSQIGVMISLDGGTNWQFEPHLNNAVSAGGKIICPSNTVIADMIFNRSEPSTRFVCGDAGVFCTIDGFNWITLFDAIAIPGRPESAFFDGLSNLNDRALYVEFEGRSILRLGDIPSPFGPFFPFDDMMLYAAIVD